MIIVEDRDGWHKGVRELEEKDVDKAWAKFEFRAKKHYGSRLRYFECYQLARRSPEVIQYISSQGKKESSWKDVYDIQFDNANPPPSQNTGPGKYRSRPAEESPYTIGELVEMRRKNEEATRKK